MDQYHEYIKLLMKKKEMEEEGDFEDQDVDEKKVKDILKEAQSNFNKNFNLLKNGDMKYAEDGSDDVVKVKGKKPKKGKKLKDVPDDFDAFLNDAVTKAHEGVEGFGLVVDSNVKKDKKDKKKKKKMKKQDDDQLMEVGEFDTEKNKEDHDIELIRKKEKKDKKDKKKRRKMKQQD